MTNRGGAQRSRPIVLTAALAVILASALAALRIGHLAANCAEPTVCISDGHGCRPGPCAVARHRAALLADGTLLAGLVLGGVLVGVQLRHHG